MLIRFGTLTLADSLNRIPVQDLDIDGRRLVQVEEFPEAEVVEIFDRGNRSTIIKFGTERQHKDEDTAQRYVALHNKTVPIKEDLLLGGTRGGWKLLYKGAGCTQCQCKAKGSRSYHQYEFTCGEDATS